MGVSASKVSDNTQTLVCTLQQALQHAASSIGASSPTPRLDAELLLAHVRGTSRAFILAHGDDNLPSEQRETFAALVARRARGEPIAYLRSSVAWWDTEIYVSPAVLIPRPDTEVVVQRALWWIRNLPGAVVADVGTGSGAIAIAVARTRTDAAVVASDISPAAIDIAAKNMRDLGLEARVRLVCGNLLEPIDSMPSVIAANLPYLSTDMMSDLAPDVRAEPVLALHGGDDGLAVYRALLQQYRQRGWLCPLVCEIDPRQSGQIVREIHQVCPTANVRVWPDLAGRYRAVEMWH